MSGRVAENGGKEEGSECQKSIYLVIYINDNDKIAVTVT